MVMVAVLKSVLGRKSRTLIVSSERPVEATPSYRFLASIHRFLRKAPAPTKEGRILYKVFVRNTLKPGHLVSSLILSSSSLASRFIERWLGETGTLFAPIIVLGKHRGGDVDIFGFSYTVPLGSRHRGFYPVMIPVIMTREPNKLKEIFPKVLRMSQKYVTGTLSEIKVNGIDTAELAESVERTVPDISPGLIAVARGSDVLDEIKAVVSDGTEYRELKIPIRTPQWTIADLPQQIVEDIKITIVEPAKKGLPFAAKGAFIIGPPGVGKTVMAEALASALGLKLVELRPSTYRSMWYGATEKTLNVIFQQLNKRRKKVILVIDDAEFLMARGFSFHEAHITEVSTVLYHLQRDDRPFTVLTANYPELIDPALIRPGRIDVVIILGYPDREMRRKAILRHLRNYRISYSEDVLDRLVEVTRWFSLAEINAIVRLAAGKGRGTIGEAEVEWAKKKFNIDVSYRRSMQDHLRWWARKMQGIIIPYIPPEEVI